jgi:hypothetical protein
MPQAATRQSTYSEILACPVFREGYEEIWRAEATAIDVRWSDEEQLSYERGRQFGLYVLTSESQRVPLQKGSMPHPRAVVLLMMAFRGGDVL